MFLAVLADQVSDDGHQRGRVPVQRPLTRNSPPAATSGSPKEQLELLDEADVIITNSGKGPINEKLANDTIFQRPARRQERSGVLVRLRRRRVFRLGPDVPRAVPADC